jgi:hypothetical protein
MFNRIFGILALVAITGCETYSYDYATEEVDEDEKVVILNPYVDRPAGFKCSVNFITLERDLTLTIPEIIGDYAEIKVPGITRNALYERDGLMHVWRWDDTDAVGVDVENLRYKLRILGNKGAMFDTDHKPDDNGMITSIETYTCAYEGNSNREKAR